MAGAGGSAAKTPLSAGAGHEPFAESSSKGATNAGGAVGPSMDVGVDVEKKSSRMRDTCRSGGVLALRVGPATRRNTNSVVQEAVSCPMTVWDTWRARSGLAYKMWTPCVVSSA